MDFLLKKKKFKFQVDFMIADLTDVPFVVATLFAKVRLLDGGTFCEQSDRVAIVDHHVYWGSLFKFTTRIASNPTTGILEPCTCRVSIRKELKGGKSHEKLGFVDVNLSEYAGSGVDGISRSYILEGYNSGHQRQDNSRLRINVSMSLLSADTCFKVPTAKVVGSALSGGKDTEAGDTGTIKARSAVNLSPPAADIVDLNPADRKAPNSSIPKTKVHLDDQMSVESGFDSLPRLPKTVDSVPTNNGEFIPGHSRDSSSASQQSKASGYASSLTHSRQSSSGQSESGHVRRASDGQLSSMVASTRSDRIKSTLSSRPNSILPHSDTAEGSMGATRVDADLIIATLFKDAQLDLESNTLNQSAQGQGLQLFINKEDGRIALGSQADSTAQMRRNFGAFEPVIVEHSEDSQPPVFTCTIGR